MLARPDECVPRDSGQEEHRPALRCAQRRVDQSGGGRVANPHDAIRLVFTQLDRDGEPGMHQPGEWLDLAVVL